MSEQKKSSQSLADIIEERGLTDEEVVEYLQEFFKESIPDLELACFCGKDKDYKGKRCFGCPDS